MDRIGVAIGIVDHPGIEFHDPPVGERRDLLRVLVLAIFDESDPQAHALAEEAAPRIVDPDFILGIGLHQRLFVVWGRGRKFRRLEVVGLGAIKEARIDAPFALRINETDTGPRLQLGADIANHEIQRIGPMRDPVAAEIRAGARIHRRQLARLGLDPGRQHRARRKCPADSIDRHAHRRIQRDLARGHQLAAHDRRTIVGRDDSAGHKRGIGQQGIRQRKDIASRVGRASQHQAGGKCEKISEHIGHHVTPSATIHSNVTSNME